MSKQAEGRRMGAYTPKTGAACGCKRGVQRDNCPNCEGTGRAIDFRAIHAEREQRKRRIKADHALHFLIVGQFRAGGRS